MNKNSTFSILKKVVIPVLIIFICVIIFLNFFLMFKGKEILSARLSQAAGRKIQIEKVGFKFPFSIFIDGITVDGISPAKEVLIKLGFSNVFRSQFVVKRIVLRHSVIVLVRDQNGKLTLKGLKTPESQIMVEVPESTSTSKEVSSQPNDVKTNARNSNLRISVNQIILENSTLDFTNERSNSDEDKLKFKQVRLDNFTLKIKDFVWPIEPRPIAFRLKGLLSIPDFALNQKILKSDGWVNIVEKDMNGNLDIAESESESSLHAQFVSQNNDMVVTGNIKMANFMNRVSPKEEAGSKGLDQMIFGALSQMGVEVGLDFSFKTKMDKFEITNVSFTGNVVTKQQPAVEKKLETK